MGLGVFMQMVDKPYDAKQENNQGDHQDGPGIKIILIYPPQ
jgi:hypothetical protein